MTAARTVLAGQPWPLGATPMTWQGQAGVNLAVFSRHAAAVHCCLFDAAGAETARVALPAVTDGIRHGFVPGVAVGQLYGLRAEGPWQPAAGHRFNPARLLIDPYARELVGSTATLATETASAPDASGHEQPDARDNAARVPKARVVDVARELAAGAAVPAAPFIAREHVVLYEAHVKGLTRLHPQVPEPLRGTYAGLASAPLLAHYRQLGITTLCLLPVQLHVDERHLLDLGLVNYWGYNTLGFFIPDPRYAASADTGQAVRDEFRAMVGELHRHGIEVVLDVVYNHTAEGGDGGPTLSWRGLDNAASYALDGSGHYLNFTGCGNALNMGEPRMVRLVTDSLRWWVLAFGVDGFRFDLAATLGRDPALHRQFNPAAALFTAIAQDPILARVRLIAEPWDVAPGGWQVGAFPLGWQEWNDRFRDTARMYWLEHECTPGQLARRLTGSDDLFADDGRSPLASINMITAHDGFTLADLTAYRLRHNEANGEHNRDGHGNNHSANGGVEGPTQDAAVLRKRTAWRRALLATLFLAQGTPQLLAGDELGNSQQGNNNAYCQDNAIGWVDWADEAPPTVRPEPVEGPASTGSARTELGSARTELGSARTELGSGRTELGSGRTELELVAALSALRRRYPAFRHPRWFQGHPFHEPGHPYTPGGDIAWLRPDGLAMSDQDWDDPWERSFAYVIEVGEGAAPATERVMVLMHPAPAVLAFVLPPGPWRVALDTSQAGSGDGQEAVTGRHELAGPAVCVLVQAIAP